MPEYTWDADKNEWLRRNRGLSFDDVVYHLEHGGFLDDVPHPNQQLHPGQRLYIIRIGNYASATMPTKFPFTATATLNP